MVNSFSFCANNQAAATTIVAQAIALQQPDECFIGHWTPELFRCNRIPQW